MTRRFRSALTRELLPIAQLVTWHAIIAAVGAASLIDEDLPGEHVVVAATGIALWIACLSTLPLLALKRRGRWPAVVFATTHALFLLYLAGWLIAPWMEFFAGDFRDPIIQLVMLVFSTFFAVLYPALLVACIAAESARRR